MKKVGIVGLGLIGGSLAKALRNRFGVEEIVAMNRNQDVLEQAYKEGVIQNYTTQINGLFSHCDAIFLCTPVDIIPDYAQQLLPYLTKDCILTDVGSTKNGLYHKIQQLSKNITYIGGHPMTGSERFRYQASKEHLFENAYYILTPGEDVPEKKIEQMRQMVTAIGAIPIVISPKEHDHVVAAISHVPQIIASGLVNLVKDMDSKEGYMHLLAAGGFRDTTRIASSSPDMWESVCMENKEEIVSALTQMEQVISSIKNNILTGSEDKVYQYFEEAKTYRDSFATLNPKSIVKRYEINVDVLDKPGSIAIIAVLFSSNGINIKNMSIVNSRERENGVLHFAFDSEEQRQKSIALLRDMNYDVTSKD